MWLITLVITVIIGIVTFVPLTYCLFKCVWNVWKQWHYDVLPEQEEAEEEDDDEVPPEEQEQAGGEVKNKSFGCVSTTYACSGMISSDSADSYSIPTKPPTLNVQMKCLSAKDTQTIGKILIRKFKSQRKLPAKWKRMFGQESTQKQFSVLYVFNFSFMKQQRKNGSLLSNFPVLAQTNNNKKFFPLDKDLSNYITARPHSGSHAEELIAGKFHRIVEECVKEEKEKQYIILYTWLFPCKKCASLIISKIRKNAVIEKEKKVPPDLLIYVLYSRVRRDEKEGKEEIKNDLESEGIYVKYVNT